MLDIEIGEEVKDALRFLCAQRPQRTTAKHAVCVILAFLGMSCKRHKEQCTLAEFSAYVVRGMIARVDLAAEARAKKPRKPMCDEDSEHDSDSVADSVALQLQTFDIACQRVLQFQRCLSA